MVTKKMLLGLCLVCVCSIHTTFNSLQCQSYMQRENSKIGRHDKELGEAIKRENKRLFDIATDYINKKEISAKDAELLRFAEREDYDWKDWQTIKKVLALPIGKKNSEVLDQHKDKK